MPTQTEPPRKSSIFHLPFRSKKQQQQLLQQPRAQSIDSSFLPPKYIPKTDQQAQPPRNKLRKSVPNNRNDSDLYRPPSRSLDLTNQPTPKGRFPIVGMSDAWERDKQTGEIIDHTNMLHALAQTETNEDAYQTMYHAERGPPVPGQDIVSKLKPQIWSHILQSSSIGDLSSLAFSCKAFQNIVGAEPWIAMKDPNHREDKIDFLKRLDKRLPKHLLCFDCAIYHVRTQRGQESLKPANHSNPLYGCPNAANPHKIAPRIRITFGRNLPFTFVQLALRAHRYSAAHGISLDSLSRRYKDRDSSWSHQTRYVIVKNHLLMRVTSQCFGTAGLPPSGLRHLLYSREDFVPYFSVCPHWRDGELMPNVKCALSHIPKPPEGSGVNRVAQEVQQRIHPTNPIITLCENCRPMRRCPECPTEYLIEMRMTEDRSDPKVLFKQALIVTRWSDLGDGTSPWSPEWAACEGSGTYDSFTALGKRAVSGIFEAEVYGDVTPGQRILSLNPNNEKKGEEGHNWY